MKRSAANETVSGNKEPKKPRKSIALKPKMKPCPPSGPMMLDAQMFVDPSKWKCETCMVFNEKETKQCISCETWKPGCEEATKATSNNSQASGCIGAGGFTFSSSGTGIGAGGFTFGKAVSAGTKPTPAAATNTAAPTGPGFVFGAAMSNTTAHQKVVAAPAFDEPGVVATFGSGDCAQIDGPSVMVQSGIPSSSVKQKLGHGEDVTELPRPRPIKALAEAGIVSLMAGGLHTLALSREGKLWSWGCNDDACLGREGDANEPAEVNGIDGKVTKYSAGSNHSAALTEDGSLWLWGTYRGDNGHIGFNKDTLKMHKPFKMELKVPRIKQLRVPVAAVACGADHTAALTAPLPLGGGGGGGARARGGVGAAAAAAARLLTWGAGAQGQLGRRVVAGREENGLEPRLVILDNATKCGRLTPTSVHCGSHNTFVVTAPRGVEGRWEPARCYAFGLNNYGQLGLGDRADRHTPARVYEIEKIIKAGGFRDISSGVHHTLVLLANGDVYGCGRTDSGQLGGAGADAGASGVCRTLPGRVPGLPGDGVAQLAAGDNHNLALSASKDLYSWGYGGMLQLGNCRESDEATAFRINLKGERKVLCVAAGGQHSAILVETNTT